MKEKDLKKFGENFKSQWEEGFMLLPAGFSAKIVDDEWISAKKTLPEKEIPVLVWYSYWAEDDDSEISYTYGFGWIDKDGKWVVHEECKEILAWMPLPGAYYPEE